MNAPLQIGLFQTDEAVVDQWILEAVNAYAIVVFSLSGGKDSTAATWAAMRKLDELGHPRQLRFAIHADLGRAEWKSTPATVESIASFFGLELIVARHKTHDMVSRWEARGIEGRRRYEHLEVFNLIGPWSSSSLRFCTSELKQQVISRALQKRFPGQTVVSVIGIRREESFGRRLAPVSKHEQRWDQANGTRIISWNPIVEFTTAQVFALHERHGLPLHEAYTIFNSSRVSCAFCVMQSLRDQKASASAPDNRELLSHLVGVEAWSTYSFQPDRWLADLSPHLLSDGLRSDIETAKRKASERRALEAALPADLRYVKGWPPRAPTMPEASQIVSTRATILGHHGLRVIFPTPRDVIARFQELLDLKAGAGAADTSTLDRPAIDPSLMRQRGPIVASSPSASRAQLIPRLDPVQIDERRVA